MKENPPSYDVRVEDGNVKIKRLGEGVSTGWEGERLFTTEEVMAAVKELDPKAEDLCVTDKLLSFEGVLLSASLRAPGSVIGYSFMMKRKPWRERSSENDYRSHGIR